jgi:transcriptional regulator with XRE-family HTH domain
MKIGSAIKKCRQIRGMTLDSLAKKIGLSKSYLSLVEGEKRDLSLSSLQKVSEALDLPVHLLVYLATSPKEIKEMDARLKSQFDALILELIKND